MPSCDNDRDADTCCSVCFRPATFVIPEKYCDDCWARWWGALDPSGTMLRHARRHLFWVKLFRPWRWLKGLLR